MIPTEELRKGLDERGIEWTAPSSPAMHDITTDWEVAGVDYEAIEMFNGTFRLTARYKNFLPSAQAVVVTVGVRKTTTRNGKYKTKYGRRIPLCECCGYSIGDDRYNFCPKCGAEIVGDEK